MKGFMEHHVENPAGEYCRCGQDAVSCQRCGRRVCGSEAKWLKGTGNLCQRCQKFADPNQLEG